MAKHTTATETVDTLIDLKKQSQCIVTKAPTPSKPKKSFLLIANNCFLYAKKSNKAIKAISILYHTKWIASSVINLPNMPVEGNFTIQQVCDACVGNDDAFAFTAELEGYKSNAVIRYWLKENISSITTYSGNTDEQKKILYNSISRRYCRAF